MVQLHNIGVICIPPVPAKTFHCLKKIWRVFRGPSSSLYKGAA